MSEIFKETALVYKGHVDVFMQKCQLSVHGEVLTMLAIRAMRTQGKMRLDYQAHPTDSVREADSCCSWDDVTSNAAKETVLENGSYKTSQP